MALLITFSFLIILYCFTKKIKLSKYIYVQTIFSIVCMILMFISPGHQARTDAYSQFRIPDYPMLNLIDKIHLGITSTCSYFIGNFRYIFAFFSLLLFICLRKKYKNKCALFFGSIPLIWNVLLFVCPSIFETLYRSYPYNSYGQSDFAYITVSTYQDFQYYTPIIVSIIIGVSILADMILIFDSFETQILSCLILLGGFISRVIMGLSPTLYGSADRTFSFMYISFIIVGTMLLKEIGSRNEDKNLLIIAAVMAGMGI